MHRFQRTSKIAVLLLTLLVTGWVGHDSALAQDAPQPQAIKSETIECPMTLPEGEVEGETIVCGQIAAPEDWQNPDGTSILITYAVAKSQSLAPFRDPVIYFDGGPGFSSLEAVEKLSDAFSHLRRTRDIIFFDQRGNRYSANLDCPYEVQNPEVLDTSTPITPTAPLSMEELQALLASMPPPPTVNDDPVALVEKAREAGPPASAGRCAAYFEEQGVSLEAYSTANSVRDVVALLESLEYPEYNLYAISYGTTVALELMRYYDEHPALKLPALRSAVIDGAYPTYVDSFEHALMLPDVILDVFAACEADKACAAAYPNIRQRAIDFLAALEQTPIQLDENKEIKVFDVVGVMESAVSNEDTRALTYLPLMIDELERGEFETFLGLGQGSLPPVEVESAPVPGDLFDPLAAEVQDLAAQTRQLVTQIEALAEQSRKLSAALSKGMSPAALFAEEFVSSTENLPHYEAATIYNTAEGTVFREPTRDAIQQLAALAPQEEQALLQSIVNLLDENEIAAAFQLLRQPDYLGRLQRVNEITNRVIECNDRYANFDLPATFETLRAYEAPQLILDPTSTLSYQIDCEGYGLTADPAPLPDPVTSSLRTLVTNGALDGNTRVAWGGVVFDALTNAETITFPQSGHASTMLSQCAKDITNFFITYPDAKLNLNCIETMKPVFVLPGDALPSN